jgi:hypothetical protein
MAYKSKSNTATFEAIAELTNTGKQAYQFVNKPFTITSFAFHDKDINYQLLNVDNIDEEDDDIFCLPIPEPNPDDTDTKYDEQLFPGTLVTEKVDYGFVPRLIGNQLTDEEIQARLKKFYIQGTVKEFNATTSTYSVLPNIQFLLQSDISTFTSEDISVVSSTSTTVANDNGVFLIEDILETSSINIIPINPDDRNLTFIPPVYKVASISKSINDVSFVAVQSASATIYTLQGTIYDENNTVLKGETISVLLNPWTRDEEVDKTTGQFTISNVPGGSNYNINVFNPKYQFVSTGGTCSGYNIFNLSSDYLNLNFTGTPLSIYPLKISGYVKDVNGNGIAGVCILNSQNSIKTYTSSEAGRQGYYVIENLSGGTSYNITVFPDDSSNRYYFSPSVSAISGFSTSRSNISFVATEKYSLIDITGRVIDSTSAGIAGVAMTITPAGKTTTTDSSGYYMFSNVFSSVDQYVSAYKLCYSFDNKPLQLTVASMSSTTSSQTYTAENIVGTAGTKNMFGSINVTGVGTLSAFMIRKEGVGTNNYSFINSGGSYNIESNVLGENYNIIPISTESTKDYDFTPPYISVVSFAGTLTGYNFAASSESVGTTSYEVVVKMWNTDGSALSKSYVKPYTNKKRVNDRISINDSQVITWVSDNVAKLILSQGGYYITLNGSNYKPSNYEYYSYDALTANVTANLTASIDANSYIVSGYVNKKNYNDVYTPLENIKITQNERYTYTDVNGYYYFTDVLNTPCTVPTAVIPHTSNSPLYSFTPTGYLYTALTLNSNKLAQSFTATEIIGSKQIQINILREDGAYAKNPITFVINNQNYVFSGNVSGASFIVPMDSTSAFFVSGTINKPVLSVSYDQTDDEAYGQDFEKMREVELLPNNFTIGSFTTSTTAVTVQVKLKTYNKVGGTVWYGATGNLFDTKQHGDLYVVLSDTSGKKYKKAIDDTSAQYEYTNIESATGTGKEWIANIEHSNYYSVSSYAGLVMYRDSNYYDLNLSSSADASDINFLLEQSTGVSISGEVRNASGSLIDGVKLTMFSTAFTYGRDILTQSGKYEFVVPSGTVVHRLYPSYYNGQQVTNFINSVNSTAVYSCSSPITATTEVDWTYQDSNIRFPFLFAMQPIDFIRTQNSSTPYAAYVSTNSPLITPTANIQVPSANNNATFGSAMYDQMINDPTYYRFSRYFLSIAKSPTIAIEQKMLNYVFGGIYVYDVLYATTVNHLNIEAFLINHFNLIGSIITTVNNVKTYTPVTGNITTSMFLTKDEIDIIKNGYEYEQIMKILDDHYDSLYLVVDLRNTKVIANGNVVTQQASTVSPQNVSNIINILSQIPIDAYTVYAQDDLNWSISYNTNYFTRTALTPYSVSDDIAMLVFNAAPSDPTIIAQIYSSYGIDFTPNSCKFFTIAPLTTQQAQSQNSASVDTTIFGNYQLKPGDIKAVVYEYTNDGKYIRVPEATNVELVCGFREIPSVLGYKYQIDNISHPSLVRSKNYVLSLGYEFDEYPRGTFPMNHKYPYGSTTSGETTLDVRFHVSRSIWDSTSINSPVEKVYSTVDPIVKFEEVAITKINNVNAIPDYEYKIGLMPREKVSPTRRMTTTTGIYNIANSCGDSAPYPLETSNYWIGYMMKYFDTNTAYDCFNKPVNYVFQNGNQSLTSIRTVLSQVVSNSTYSYEQKEQAINSHLDNYINSVRNILLNAIVAYRENNYIRTYSIESSMNDQQRVHQSSLKYKVLVPTAINQYQIFEGIANGELRTVGMLGEISLKYNKQSGALKSAIKTWIQTQTDKLTIRIEVSQPAIADSMVICSDIVESGSRVANYAPTQQPTQTQQYQWSHSQLSLWQYKDNATNNIIYLRHVENWTSASTSQSQPTNRIGDNTGKIPRIDRWDMLKMPLSDSTSQQFIPYITKFMTFGQHKQQPNNDYTNIIRWDNNPSQNSYPKYPYMYSDSIDDFIYMYRDVFSKLTTNVWSSKLFVTYAGYDYNFRIGLPTIARILLDRTGQIAATSAEYRIYDNNLLGSYGPSVYPFNSPAYTTVYNSGILVADKYLGTNEQVVNMIAGSYTPYDYLGSNLISTIDPNDPNAIDYIG